MVKRKICVVAISIIIGIEILAASILRFVFGNGLIQSNVKKSTEHRFCF
jgi:hypothetical protein